MKNIKKLLSIVMVLTLVLALGAQAFAATVTVNDPGHTYTAYQIFKGDNQAADEGAIGDLEWGDGITPETFIEGLQKISKFAELKDGASARDVAEILSGIEETDTETLHTVAAAAKAAIKGDGIALADKSEVAIGYYLIVDTTENLPQNEMQNDLVLQVTQNVEVTAKRDVPKSDKKVQEKNDSAATEEDTNPTGWQDGADYDIGDSVPFRLTGELPNNYSSYESYTVTFHDTQSAGLTFDPASVKIYLNNTGDFVTGDTVGVTITQNATHSNPDGSSVTHAFDIQINVKTVFPSAGNDDVIYVYYNSTLNDGATLGSAGNPNTNYMEYTNKFDGSGTTRTPDDKVIVFTYELDVNKKDGEGEDLAGAGFTLYKKVPTGTEGATTLEGHTGSYVVVKEIEAGETVKFEFKGQDAGDYLLVESKVPDGYNKADDLEFTVAATYDTDKADPELTDLSVKDKEGKVISGAEGTFTAAANTGLIGTDVTNLTGLELPETGGIGTTIFYVVGGILVAAAVILLVTKRRVSGTEK